MWKWEKQLPQLKAQGNSMREYICNTGTAKVLNQMKERRKGLDRWR
jgi:hypothetical protein